MAESHITQTPSEWFERYIGVFEPLPH
jgi:hypothetical protein